MPTVTLTSGTRFDAQPDESILAAALKAGVFLEHSCRTGRCSACRAKVVEGDTITLQAELGLSPDERAAGWVLSCCRAAPADVVVDQRELGRQLPKERILPAKVHALDRLADDLLRVRLRLPPRAEFEFLPGQYIDVSSPQGVKRSYSVASAPEDRTGVELLIRRVEAGAMSRYWFDLARPDDLVRIHGPKGTFFVRDNQGGDIVFLATGTGIAPVESMVKSLLREHQEASRITVLWGNRQPADFVVHPSGWHPEIRYIPVLSRPAEAWAGARGHVQDHFERCKVSWNAAEVYACGSPAMIEDSRKVLEGLGLSERRFFSDAFVCSA